jgi:hypothetical protein
MSIKIKTLKRFLLIFVSLVFGSINYLNYVQAEVSTDVATKIETPGITDTISDDFQKFLDSKKGQPLTLTELKDFTAKVATNRIGSQNTYATFEELPQVEKSEIKILSQKYPELSEEKRAAQIQKDNDAYLSKTMYIIFSNLPKSVLSTNDIISLKDEFFSNLVDLNGKNNEASIKYFTDLGTRMDLVLSQMKDLEVPESMVDIYTKSIRLTKALSTIKDDKENLKDPITQVVVLKKITNLTTLTTDFFKTDISAFLKVQLKSK